MQIIMVNPVFMSPVVDITDGASGHPLLLATFRAGVEHPEALIHAWYADMMIAAG